MDVPNVSSSMQRIMRADLSTAEQESTQKVAQTEAEATLAENLSPTASLRPGRQATIKSRTQATVKAEQMREKGINLPIQEIEDMAKEFEEQSQGELDHKALLSLLGQIKKGDKPGDILKLLQKYFGDVTLMDHALEFLLAACHPDLKEVLIEVKRDLNQQFGREIAAGRNVREDVLEASRDGLDTPATLRDLYRNITGTPRETTTLFNELANKYPYKKLREVIRYLLHSVGSDLKSKGPSIPRGLLHNLLKEVRSLQAILGLYNFFKGRMPLLKKLLEKEGIPLPPELTFEALARQFMGVIDDRYPSPEKILQSAVKLGIDKSVLAKIYTFSQERDAVREVAFNLIYRSLEHRYQVSDALIGALDILEDQLEDMISKQKDLDEDNF